MADAPDPEGPFFSVADLLRWRWKGRSAPAIEPPLAAIFCPSPGLVNRARRSFALKPVKGLFGECFLVKKSRGRVALASGFGVGAPAIAILAEEYAAFGVRQLLLLGTAGSLQPDLNSGDVVVCTQALRSEGTSIHYLPPAPRVEADQELVWSLGRALTARRISFACGPSWTTDTPYRETYREVDLHRREGILTVEMESAALFAAASRLGVRAAAVFVVADRLLLSGWEPPEKMATILDRQSEVLEAVIGWLAGVER